MTAEAWWQLRDEELLEKKISDLGLQISGTWFAPLIQRLYSELQERGLAYHPPCFLADEWFVPVGVPAIGVPFYLAHPRLQQLEQKMVLEVEGGTESDFMKLIRHEAGHAYSYAFNLYKKKLWRTHFGSASEEYPDTYRPKPYSRSYVLHLDSWYAQSHPDEDFAETFAVWLTPASDWRERYRGWKAIEKLHYVDGLMRSLKDKRPAPMPYFKPALYAGLNMKLKTLYRNKRKMYEQEFPDFYDRDLRTLFTDKPEERGPLKASRYLRRNSDALVRAAGAWTKEKKYRISELLKKIITRCDQLNLYVKKDDKHTDFQLAAFVATLVSNHLFTGKFKLTK